MLIDASSYKNLDMLGIVESIEDLETAKQVAEEMEMRVQRIHEVTYEELDTFLEYLKLIARRADITISVEVKQEEEVSTTLNVNPKSSKGRKITLHYGEVYLLARAINQPDTILCDDESVFYLNVLLSGICGVNLDVDRTIEHLYFMFESGTLSATDFKKPGRECKKVFLNM
ncbi:MAG TPA: hypothetical protein EYP22_02190 [Methanosarcinales archaeon]|nr:hypothetical protein [Methanosarcinales archaeon]